MWTAAAHFYNILWRDASPWQRQKPSTEPVLGILVHVVDNFARRAGCRRTCGGKPLAAGRPKRESLVLGDAGLDRAGVPSLVSAACESPADLALTLCPSPFAPHFCAEIAYGTTVSMAAVSTFIAKRTLQNFYR